MATTEYANCTGCCGGGVEVCCCEGVTLPTTLTVSDGTNSVDVVHNGTFWTKTGVANFAGQTNVTVSVVCLDMMPPCRWEVSAGAFSSPATLVGCDPLELTASLNGYSVTVSE